MEGVDAKKSTGAHHAVLAGFLGWTLDAFDFLSSSSLSTRWRTSSEFPSKASDSARGLTSGLVYQCGILFAAPTSSIEYSLRDRIGYQWAITTFEIVTILSLSLLLWKGVEQHGRRFADLLPSGNENGVNKSAKFRTEATVVKL